MATPSALKLLKTNWKPSAFQALGSPKRRFLSSHPCSPYRPVEVECRAQHSSPLSHDSQASLSAVPLTVPASPPPHRPVGLDEVEVWLPRRPAALSLDRVPSLSLSFFPPTDGTPSTRSTVSLEENSPSSR